MRLMKPDMMAKQSIWERPASADAKGYLCPPRRLDGGLPHPAGG